MKTFLSFAFTKNNKDGTQSEGFGRVIVNGCPQSTQELLRVEQALNDQMKLDDPPTIINMTPIPENKTNGKPRGLIIPSRG